MFAATQIGELISIAPGVTFVLDRGVAKGSIIKCAERFFDSNMNAFVKFFGLNRSAANSLWKGMSRVTQLELLLKIGFHIGMTLLDLLTREDSLDGFNPLRSSTLLGNRLSPRLKKEKVLKVLLAAVEETPPPSLNEIAERLGYSSSHTLRCYFPQVCDQIAANYQQSSRGKEKRKFSTSRLQKNEVIKSALESALKETYPPPVSHIARQLGYTSSQALRPRFPDLCRALADKRLTLASIRRGQSKPELEQALSVEPPISLDSIVKKLGYRTNAELRKKYPELCRKIRDRWTTYNRTQLMLKIKHEVELILVESPPPTLRDALQRMGISYDFLRRHFPNEHRLIPSRYAKFRKNQSEQNKESDRNKIRGIIQDFIKRGIFPSMNAVLDIFIPSYLKRPDVLSTIMQSREEFGFRV